MRDDTTPMRRPLAGMVFAEGERPAFSPGDKARILARSPIGHYRVPTYMRGKLCTVEKIIEPAAVDNEEEAFGRNSGSKRHYYRVAVPMSELWPEYNGQATDGLRIEIYETWLERVSS